MERKFNFSVGEFYHIYNRGNNKSDIFLTGHDRQRFQKLLYACNSTEPVVFKTIQGLPLDKIVRGKPLVSIGAYCLMSNHFHLLVREVSEGGISAFLSKVLTAYSMYFNKKNERTGKLFEGPFRATHVGNDEYLKYLFSYIHLNPVKLINPKWKEERIVDRVGAMRYLKGYHFSSYVDYVGISRPEQAILSRSDFPEYFNEFKEFERFIAEWLSFNEEE